MRLVLDAKLSDFVPLPMQVRGCVSPYMSTNVLHKISERDLYAG
jgi:hypothetical protein